MYREKQKGLSMNVNYTKQDCGSAIRPEEVRAIQVDMLNTLAKYCDQHGLRYFLSGGTLLGAIRHQGFIPWDDDIDVNIPRPDCERLMELSGGKLGQYVLAGPDMDCSAPDCEWYRMYAMNTVIENYCDNNRKYPRYHPIFLDVFPIEGLPKSVSATKWHYFKIVVLRKMQRASCLKHKAGKSIGAHIFHIIAAVPGRFVGYERWSRWIQKVAMKYDFGDSEYIGVMTAPVHTIQEKVKKSDYLKVVDVTFEGNSYHAPGNYDVYLTQLYGDYMELPPEEKRCSRHEFNMYWKRESGL